MSTAYDYWAQGRGLESITPKGLRWPEGPDFPEFLVRLIGNRIVLEFGCGIGRLAGLFDRYHYCGVDISKQALALAHVEHPHHRFELIDEHSVLPYAEVTLAHTVLLHVPDDKLRPTVSRFRSPVVFVSEILGTHWRRPFNPVDTRPPVFNRELDDYRSAFTPEYRLNLVTRRPYPHYPDTELSIMTFVKNDTGPETS